METNVYISRKNQVIEQAELIREERKKMQAKLMKSNITQKAKRTTGLTVPKYIQSSKNIMAEKKIAQAGQFDTKDAMSKKKK